MKKIFPWLGVTAAVAIVGLAASASASSAAEEPAAPSSLVEDYVHPGADQILAQHQLKVFKGDGHIIFVTSRTIDEGQCDVGQIQVERRTEEAPFDSYYCFRSIGTKGFLTLEVPATFGVRGGTQSLQATANLPDGPEKYQVPANGYVAVSPGSGDEIPQAVLVELRLT
jgi:hypothetical protein